MNNHESELTELDSGAIDTVSGGSAWRPISIHNWIRWFYSKIW